MLPIAKTAQINDEIYAGNTLDVILGENQISVQDGKINQLSAAHKHNGISSTTRQDNTPTLALGISSLGGMYAGKIHLIGADKGFGVNNAGVITATGKGVQTGTGTHPQIVKAILLIQAPSTALKPPKLTLPIL